jgi:hypothetical protein
METNVTIVKDNEGEKKLFLIVKKETVVSLIIDDEAKTKHFHIAKETNMR